VERFTSFDGNEIAYLDAGQGPFVFLLHGFAADHLVNWVQPGVVDALVASGCRVIAADARGHGVSAKPHDPAAYSNDAMVHDVEALMDHLGADRAHVVGYSMGSIVAARLTSLDPRVRSLVLGGVGGRLGQERRPGSSLAAVADALEADDPNTITDNTARAFRHFADLTGADRLALAAVQRAAGWEPAALDRIAVPTMVLTGDKDILVGRPEDLAAKIAGATVTVVKGDHLRAVGDPAFTAAIVDFVGSATPATA
jgi:pimeloyl-ACP methyl ester carboxylesterase